MTSAAALKHLPALIALSVAVDVEGTATAACDPDLLRRYAVPYRVGSVEQTESVVTALRPTDPRAEGRREPSTADKAGRKQWWV